VSRGRRGRLLGLLAAIGASPWLASCVSARATQDSLVAPPEMVESAARYRKEYVLVADDQVEIVVQRVPEVSRNVIVRPDGRISLPLVGDVDAAGRTPVELAAQLTGLFAKRLVDPEVAVITTRVRPAMVYVAGEVQAPSAVPLHEAATAIQAITRTGGFKRSAATNDVVLIRLNPDGHLRATRLPSLMKGFDGQPNSYLTLSLVTLQPDDLIFVPENGRSQFTRAVNDLINTPLSGINSLFAPIINYRLVQVLGQQAN
jgi:polysaccharide export outer membrane protein